jgi:hypothetical protein
VSKFLSVFQYFPFVVAGVNAVEASMPTAPGTTKKAAILSAIDAAASIGMQVPEAHVRAISAFIDFKEIIMRKFVVLALLICAVAWSQVFPPANGGSSVGVVNPHVSVAGPAATTGPVDITALNLTTQAQQNSLIAECRAGTGFAAGEVTGDLGPLLAGCAITARSSTSVTVIWTTSTANVRVAFSSNGGAGPQGSTGAVGPTGSVGVAGATGPSGPLGSSVSNTFSAGATTGSFAHNLGFLAHITQCINATGQEVFGVTKGATTDTFSWPGGLISNTVCTYSTGGAGGAAVAPLVLTGTTDTVQWDLTCNATQTTPCARIRKSDGTVFFQVNNDGSVQLGSGTGPLMLSTIPAPGSNPASGKFELWADNSTAGFFGKDSAGLTYQMVHFPGGTSTFLRADNTWAVPPGSGGTVNGFTNYYPITIDHTQVPSTQANFPVMFRSPVGTVTTAGTAVTLSTGDAFPAWLAGKPIQINAVNYTVASVAGGGGSLTLTGSAGTQASPVPYHGTPDFATAANGGLLANASAFDLVLSTDTTCATPLPFERVSWSATTGDVELHYLITSLSSTVDTTPALCFNKPSIVSDQSTPASVWVGYAGVWHMPNGSSLTAQDSTSNANNGTLTNAPTACAGAIDGGACFVHTGNSYIDLGAGTSLRVTGGVSIEAWVSYTDTLTAHDWRIFSNLDGGPNYAGFELFHGAGGQFNFQNGNGTTSGGISGAGLSNIATPSGGVVANTNYYVVATFDGVNTAIVYINGVASATLSTFSTSAASTVNSQIGQYPGAGGKAWNGMIDEVRVYNGVLTPNRIATSLANQNTPFSFQSLGTRH